MGKLLCALLLATTGFAAPPAYRVRIHLEAPLSLGADASRLQQAILRGLYSDSIIVPGPDSMLPNRGDMRDTAFFNHMTRAAVITGELEQSGDTIVARLRLLNILTQPMLPPDTIRVPRASLDSLGVERGRAYARRLARKRA